LRAAAKSEGVLPAYFLGLGLRGFFCSRIPVISSRSPVALDDDGLPHAFYFLKAGTPWFSFSAAGWRNRPAIAAFFAG